VRVDERSLREGACRAGPIDDPRISDEQQRELWQAWIERGPRGALEDETETDGA
jgi:hypothetical protein